jgi:hypothetical protein
MNLHGIVSGKIARVNANQVISVQLSQGSTTNADGSRIPAYTAPVSVVAQVQELSTKDLRQLENLNIQGSMRKIYVNGEIDAVIRFSKKGGDLITLQNGDIYLTTTVLEEWPDWTAISVTLQNGS